MFVDQPTLTVLPRIFAPAALPSVQLSGWHYSQSTQQHLLACSWIPEEDPASYYSWTISSVAGSNVNAWSAASGTFDGQSTPTHIDYTSAGGGNTKYRADATRVAGGTRTVYLQLMTVNMTIYFPSQVLTDYALDEAQEEDPGMYLPPNGSFPGGMAKLVLHKPQVPEGGSRSLSWDGDDCIQVYTAAGAPVDLSSLNLTDEGDWDGDSMTLFVKGIDEENDYTGAFTFEARDDEETLIGSDVIKITVPRLQMDPIDPDVLPADGVSTTQATAQTRPTDLPLNWRDYCANLDYFYGWSPVEITTQSSTGPATVRAQSWPGSATVEASVQSFSMIKDEKTVDVVGIYNVDIEQPILADGQSTTLVRATIVPWHRQISWTLIDEPAGASIAALGATDEDGNATAVVTAGTKYGTYIVEAHDSIETEILAYGEDSIVSAPALWKVSFQNVAKEMVSDGAYTQLTYSAPHYYDKNINGVFDWSTDRAYPVCYVRGNTVQLSATIWSWGLPAGRPVKVRTQGSTIGNLPEIEVLSGENSIDVPKTDLDAALPNQVAYYKDISMIWEVSLNDGATWIEVGKNTHDVYSLLAAPQPESYFQESLAYISCKAAAGTNTSTGVFNAVWSKIESLSVERKDSSAAMLYWGANVWSHKDDSYYGDDYYELLSIGDGRCGAWARLMINLLRTHGLTSYRLYPIKPKPTLGQLGSLLFDKSWLWTATGSPLRDMSFNHVQGGVLNYGGHFADHVVVILNENSSTQQSFWDPSYGFFCEYNAAETIKGLQAYEYKSFSGYSYLMSVGPPVNVTYNKEVENILQTQFYTP